MTQINEIKRNTLPNFIYAFPMSTANLHSSPIDVLPSFDTATETIKTVLFFQFLPGNSHNSLVALQPFSSLNERIKILLSYDKGAIVTTVTTQYHSNVL